jgi:hypothetical protein
MILPTAQEQKVMLHERRIANIHAWITSTENTWQYLARKEPSLVKLAELREQVEKILSVIDQYAADFDAIESGTIPLLIRPTDLQVNKVYSVYCEGGPMRITELTAPPDKIKMETPLGKTRWASADELHTITPDEFEFHVKQLRGRESLPGGKKMPARLRSWAAILGS